MVGFFTLSQNLHAHMVVNPNISNVEMKGESHDKSLRMLMIQTLLEIKIAIEFVPQKGKMAQQNEQMQESFKQKGARLSRWMAENPNVRMFQGSDPVLVRLGYQVRDVKVELKENLKHIVDKGFHHEVSGWDKDPYFRNSVVKIDKLISEIQKIPDPISSQELRDLKSRVEKQFIPLVLF